MVKVSEKFKVVVHYRTLDSGLHEFSDQGQAGQFTNMMINCIMNDLKYQGDLVDAVRVFKVTTETDGNEDEYEDVKRIMKLERL